ncbi:DUF6807 family protein [Agromyces archimandritae]|uniref:PmoA family protein n=1 Tax=Agromyces archimandritae TaxID=2781962 RepID=A0A975FMI7_9MICO|nr:DUF6807 family protein [Agromyces archimandritae]QTX03736.1 PmoA family protein [Agromyces archimandritae]
MPDATRRHVTIAQVAARAGVSQASVSRVLNRNQRVDPAIAARVRAAIDELGYAPSQTARSLARGRSNTVALVVPDLENPVFQGVLGGLSREAARDGTRVLVADTAERVEDEEAVATEARFRCDALVIVSPRMPAERLDALIARTRPAVVVNRPVAADPAAELSVDFEHAARTLGEHLLGLGHRRIVFLAGPPHAHADGLRRRGFAALTAAHPGAHVHEVDAGSQLEDGFRAAEAVLASGATAVACFNDLVALGLIARLRELGIDVPGELSVAGFDDIPLARFAAPSLTTVSVPHVELGVLAWRRLRDAIAGEPAAHPLSLRTVLRARASTGPAPAGDGWIAPRHPALRIGGRTLARYADGAAVPDESSPRPYLHPITTSAGTPLTAIAPGDHPHHFGLGLAIADVNGTSTWGGRSFVAGTGSVMLDNHGRQRRDGLELDGDGLSERLTWVDAGGAPLVDERRTVRGRAWQGPGGPGWMLGWRSRLTAAHGPLTFGSPATNGRPGAGYGGVFWRFPAVDAALVVTADGTGEAVAHGSRSPWLAVVDAARGASVLLAQPGVPRPWFVRVAEYLGVGPALAWDETVRVPAGGSVELGLDALMLDEAVTDPERLAGLAAELAARRAASWEPAA